MDMVKLWSLNRLFRERRRFTWEQVIQYGLQVYPALPFDRERSVIHWSLTPVNILLIEDGTIKLSDFDLVRDVGASGLTAAGRTVGTLIYRAPE